MARLYQVRNGLPADWPGVIDTITAAQAGSRETEARHAKVLDPTPTLGERDAHFAGRAVIDILLDAPTGGSQIGASIRWGAILESWSVRPQIGERNAQWRRRLRELMYGTFTRASADHLTHLRIDVTMARSDSIDWLRSATTAVIPRRAPIGYVPQADDDLSPRTPLMERLYLSVPATLLWLDPFVNA